MSIVPEGCDHHGQTNGTTQLLIDEKIAHFEECIRQLKAQRNALAPISELPPEILARIFFFASAGRTRLSPVLPFYYFSHVSELWRSVALNTPTLWQVLPRSIQWATAMLERSKGADLVVESHADSSPRQSLFLTEVLTKHTSRIRELDLSGSNISTFLENLQPSSLRLHSLKLECPRIGVEFSPASGAIGFVDTTNLRTLSVTNYGGSWCSLPLPSLTNLKLHNVPRPPLNDFLEVLRGAAGLEVLDMNNSLPSANNHVDPIRPIELPLSYLSLSSNADYKEVTNVLSAIIVPRTATLKLSAVITAHLAKIQVKAIADGLASSLRSFFCRHSNFSYHDLRISGGGYLCLAAWKDDGAISLTPDLELDLPMAMASPNTLRTIFPSMPLFNITTLTLNISLDNTLLKDLFGRLSRLKNVRVAGDSTDKFLQVLTSKPKNHNTSHTAYYTVSFPALESLWIEECSFKEGWGLTVEDLQDCLIERCERKAEILKLKLTECRELWSYDVQNLRHIVSDVEWDGWEETDESDESEENYSDDYYSDDYYY